MSNFSFDELEFFAAVKSRPGLYFGHPSLISLRDHLFGMQYAFSVCGKKDALKYFTGFIEWYNRHLFESDKNGYACWWNHILYTSGNMDELAFSAFFRTFEAYLLEEYDVKLPHSSVRQSS